MYFPFAIPFTVVICFTPFFGWLCWVGFFVFCVCVLAVGWFGFLLDKFSWSSFLWFHR